MSHYTPADLDMSRRHIAQGERHVVQQEQLLTRLRLNLLPTEAAEVQLTAFYHTLSEHRAHHAIIVAALGMTT